MLNMMAFICMRVADVLSVSGNSASGSVAGHCLH